MPAPSPSWNLVRVFGTWRNLDGSPKKGVYKVSIPVKITNATDNSTIPAGTFSTGILSQDAGNPSLDIMVPSTDDPDVQQTGWQVSVEVSFADKSKSERLRIDVPYADRPVSDGGTGNGVNLRGFVTPDAIPIKDVHLKVGVPGGIALLNAEGNALNADGQAAFQQAADAAASAAGSAGAASASAETASTAATTATSARDDAQAAASAASATTDSQMASRVSDGASATRAALDGVYIRVVDSQLNVKRYASLSAAVSAAPSNATVYIPAGTYSAASIAANKNLTFVGDGPTSTIISASGTFGLIASTLAGDVIRFRDIGFTGSTSAAVLVSTAPSAAYFERCRFTDFSLYAIQSSGVSVYVDNCEFDGKGTGTGTAIIVNNGSPVVRVRNSTFRYLFRGLYVTNTGGAAQDVKVQGCTFDGGWMYLKASHSGSGGTVTYTATTVTDTAAAFSGIATGDTVRAMAVKRAGTVTTISVRRVTDSAANFTTANVQPGDILRTSDRWAVVQAVISATVLDVEEWLTLTDYQPTTNPTTTTAYTIYELRTGYVTASTATSLTVNGWRDRDGVAATPAAGTLYERAPKTDYQCLSIGSEAFTVTGCTVRRAWADSISIQGGTRRMLVANNTIIQGQDVGITVEDTANAGVGALIANNSISRCGTAGIFIGGFSDSVLEGNVIENAGISIGTLYGGIEMQGTSQRVKVTNNVIRRTVGNGGYAIHLSETITGASLDGNAYTGYATYDIQIDGTNVTAVTGTFQAGTRLNLTASAVGPVGRFSGTGVPTIAASSGSTFHRTDGGAATSLYVREGAAWAAK